MKNNAIHSIAMHACAVSVKENMVKRRPVYLLEGR